MSSRWNARFNFASSRRKSLRHVLPPTASAHPVSSMRKPGAVLLTTLTSLGSLSLMFGGRMGRRSFQLVVALRTSSGCLAAINARDPYSAFDDPAVGSSIQASSAIAILLGGVTLCGGSSSLLTIQASWGLVTATVRWSLDPAEGSSGSSGSFYFQQKNKLCTTFLT